jgi:hypothetical protein
MRGVACDQSVYLLLFGLRNSEKVLSESPNFGLDRISRRPERCGDLIRRLLADVCLKEHLHGQFS